MVSHGLVRIAAPRSIVVAAFKSMKDHVERFPIINVVTLDAPSVSLRPPVAMIMSVFSMVAGLPHFARNAFSPTTTSLSMAFAVTST